MRARADAPPRPVHPGTRRPSDGGQVVLLVIGFAVVAIALIAVVVDASRVFLYRRALSAAADGAVTAAVQAVDERAIYSDPSALSGAVLPIDEAAAREAVEQYVVDQGLAGRFAELTIRAVEVGPGAASVTVILAAKVDLPFVRMLPFRIHTVTISAIAVAHAPTE